MNSAGRAKEPWLGVQVAAALALFFLILTLFKCSEDDTVVYAQTDCTRDVCAIASAELRTQIMTAITHGLDTHACTVDSTQDLIACAGRFCSDVRQSRSGKRVSLRGCE